MSTDAKTGWGVRSLTRSRAEGRCTPTLAAWILSVADRSLRTVYGDDYSDRCLQSSECIRMILTRLGIRCDIWKGALCAAAIYPGALTRLGWSGFWGDDHHVWVATEFDEFIDLTITQLYLHRSGTRGALPVPALWWHPLDEWPPILRYLPDAAITIQLPPDEILELDRVRAEGERLFDAEFGLQQPPASTVEPILMGLESLNALDRADWPWVQACRMALADLPAWPDWMVQREQELIRRWETRSRR